MTDTTRKDMLGCYGDERMKTPKNPENQILLMRRI